jgi:hypothetical protein
MRSSCRADAMAAGGGDLSRGKQGERGKGVSPCRKGSVWGQSVHMCKRALTAVGGDAEVRACQGRCESSMKEPSIM